MNIREASIQLEKAARAYGARTPDGARLVPPEAQRPIYLVGPPGVGKSAIAAQAARRLGMGYAAYAMTHHTRQSALGLPLITRRRLNGVEQPVTEYTVSEIVADVWAKSEAGAERGMLFLDEINCVSESLMPAMLQLLQYKTFGTHALPEGWMIVCAGNPPRYNRYAHTFDGVLMDRLRVIEIEPDLEAWRAYAGEQGVHPAVLSYLALRGEDFYVGDGDRVVTARSWTDLSLVMRATEACGDAPDAGLFAQYLQIPEVAERFALYFRLCETTGARLDAALSGGDAPSLAGLPFDEALFAMLLLADRLKAQAGDWDQSRRNAERLAWFADGIEREANAQPQAITPTPGQSGRDVESLCLSQIDRLASALTARRASGAISDEDAAAERRHLSRLRELAAEAHSLDPAPALAALRAHAQQAAQAAVEREEALANALARAFDFLEASVPDPNARLILLTALRADAPSQKIIKARLQARFDGLWEGSAME